MWRNLSKLLVGWIVQLAGVFSSAGCLVQLAGLSIWLTGQAGWLKQVSSWLVKPTGWSNWLCGEFDWLAGAGLAGLAGVELAISFHCARKWRFGVFLRCFRIHLSFG